MDAARHELPKHKCDNGCLSDDRCGFDYRHAVSFPLHDFFHSLDCMRRVTSAPSATDVSPFTTGGSSSIVRSKNSRCSGSHSHLRPPSSAPHYGQSAYSFCSLARIRLSRGCIMQDVDLLACSSPTYSPRPPLPCLDRRISSVIFPWKKCFHKQKALLKFITPGAATELKMMAPPPLSELVRLVILLSARSQAFAPACC